MVIGVVLAVVVGTAGIAAGAPDPAAAPSPATGLQPSGRLLTPAGTLVELGNLPMGGAVTADGKYLWTVSAGVSSNDVRIVAVATRRVVQILPVPGASGGVAMDP